MPVKTDKVKILTKIALISFLLCSCTAKRPHCDKTVEVDIYQTPVKQTDFVDGYRHIILENGNGEALIGEISGFDINKDNIIVVSDFENVFVYNRDGKLISFFNRRGQGPNEYISIDDIKLRDETLWILCRGSKKFLTYDLSGHGLKSYNIGDWFHRFDFINDSTILLSADKGSRMPYNFVVYDLTTEKIIDKLFPYEDRDDNYMTLDYKPFISKQDSIIRFVDLFDYNIYTIDNNGKLATLLKYEFNTPFKISDYKNSSLEETDKACFRNKGIRSLGPAYYNGNISFQSFRIFIDHHSKDFVYRYDSATGQGDLIDCTITEEFPFLALPPLAFYDGWYITALTQENIEFAENKFGKKYVDGIDEDSNPVLFFHHFR